MISSAMESTICMHKVRSVPRTTFMVYSQRRLIGVCPSGGVKAIATTQATTAEA